MNDAVNALHLSSNVLYQYTNNSLPSIWNELRNNADKSLEVTVVSDADVLIGLGRNEVMSKGSMH
jgi:ribosome biogenesis protein Nip4